MKIFAYILVAIITSCYFFPFEFTFLSGVNTKLILAAVGLPFLFFNMLQMKGIILSKELTFASLIAVLFSLIGFYSTDYNNTTDYAYATYIISMWVWFSAAYFTCTLISLTHGYISVKLIVNYLAIICVFQCVIALMINFNSTVKFFVDSYFVSGDVKFMDEAERLYGIGALLDVAGGRFSVVLMFIAVLISTDRDIRNNPWTLSFYILSFFFNFRNWQYDRKNDFVRDAIGNYLHSFKIAINFFKYQVFKYALVEGAFRMGIIAIDLHYIFI